MRFGVNSRLALFARFRVSIAGAGLLRDILERPVIGRGRLQRPLEPQEKWGPGIDVPTPRI